MLKQGSSNRCGISPTVVDFETSYPKIFSCDEIIDTAFNGRCFSTSFLKQKDVAKLAKLNQAWMNAYITKDAATPDKVFATDFVLISPGGAKMLWNAIIANLGKQELVSVKIDSVDERILTGYICIGTAFPACVKNRW